MPSGVKVSGGTLWVADIFSYRKVDLASGAVSDVMRMHAEGVVMEYPFGVGISADRVVLTSWFTGTVQVLDRATNKTLVMSHGWKAPYDAILCAASGSHVPQSLINQLAPGGSIVMPVGGPGRVQTLVRVTNATDGSVEQSSLGDVRFVPLIGAEGWSDA